MTRSTAIEMATSQSPIARVGLGALLGALGVTAAIGQGLPPVEPSVASSALADVPRLELPPADLAQAARDDEARELRSAVAHYALPLPVNADPWRQGRWDVVATAGGERLGRWRLRVASPGARSLNLAFDRVRLPPGASLTVSAADGSSKAGPYAAADVEAHGRLWTPPLETDDLLVELTLPLPIERLRATDLHLASVQHGYAGFGEPSPRSGACHVDVACAEAEPWRDAARSVGLLSIEGVRFCTGFLVNTTAGDRRPLLLTARHCGITAENAASVVVFWGHESASCRGERRMAVGLGPTVAQSGATLLATSVSTDLALVELDAAPPAAARARFAGWSLKADAPGGVAVVHFPNTDAKSIAVDRGTTRRTRAFRDSPARFGDHLRVGGWSLGSTEGGSSGAPLFDATGHVVGHLRGGYAACNLPLPDWFGRLADAWNGPDPASRLRDWLDPLATGVQVLDGIDAPALPAGDAGGVR